MLWNAFSECSRWVRSRITAWARPGSFHSAGFSASAFSSSRRRAAASTSKMPPQQDQRLTDLVGHRLNFGEHGGFLATVRSVPAGVGPAGEEDRLTLYRFGGSSYRPSPP